MVFYYRCDSVGFSAHYLSYAFIDLVRKKILDLQLVTVSNKYFCYIIAANQLVKEVSTKRHVVKINLAMYLVFKALN